MRKTQTEEEKEASKKYYRCKKKDEKLYLLLTEKIARFITKKALIEVGHGNDTQVNESFNNSVAWLAPKNKTYGGSPSLYNRICVAIGIMSIGTLEYFSRLFLKLGIEMPRATYHALYRKSEARDTKIARSKLNETKKKRMQNEYDKLKEQNDQAIKERCGRDGVAYLPGMGMAGGYTEEELGENAENGHAAANDNVGGKRDTVPKPCTACGGWTHKRITSRLCAKHEEWKHQKAVQKASTEQDMIQRDAEQQSDMDGLAFTDNIKDEDETEDEVCMTSASSAII